MAKKGTQNSIFEAILGAILLAVVCIIALMPFYFLYLIFRSAPKIRKPRAKNEISPSEAASYLDTLAEIEATRKKLLSLGSLSRTKSGRFDERSKAGKAANSLEFRICSHEDYIHRLQSDPADRYRKALRAKSGRVAGIMGMLVFILFLQSVLESNGINGFGELFSGNVDFGNLPVMQFLGPSYVSGCMALLVWIITLAFNKLWYLRLKPRTATKELCLEILSSEQTSQSEQEVQFQPS